MKQSKGYEKDAKLVCLLNKALYDLKQSTRQFYLFLVDLLSHFDLKSITANQSIFYNTNIDIIIAAHIDD